MRNQFIIYILFYCKHLVKPLTLIKNNQFISLNYYLTIKKGCEFSTVQIIFFIN